MLKFQSISIVILFVFDCVQGLSSGFYTDDGNSQTVFDRALSQGDKEILAEQVLKLLGLPDRPRCNITNLRNGSLQQAAPQFLLNAYQHLLTNDYDDETIVHPRVRRSLDDTEYLLTQFDENAIDESDKIMTFASLHHKLPQSHEHREKTLWFDISDIKPGDQLISAELRIYINFIGNEDVRLIIYQLDKNSKHFLTTQQLTSWHQGWIELNVTQALYKWMMANKNNNHGLLITTDGGKLNEIEILMDNENEHQPFIVGFFHTNGISHNQRPPKLFRKKRNATQQNNKKSSSSSKISSQKNILTMGHHQQNFKHHQSCQRQTLFVSFNDLKWSDWIIAPIGFHAFYCSGECNFPLNSPTNPTNHAIVQTLVHSKHPKKVPKPCCVPTHLGHISVLYYLDETNVNLQKYKSIVVKSCGCH